MSQQHPEFSIPKAERLKQAGMEAAAEARAEALAEAREVAELMGKNRGSDGITMDDVAWAMMDECPDKLKDLGNAAGSVFRGKQWRTYGEFVQSKRWSRHRNAIRVWYWVGYAGGST